MKRILIVILLLCLIFRANSQDSKVDRFSYSLSWTPIYYGPNDGKFRLDAIIPFILEAKVHYKIVNRLSVSSGVGFQEWHRSNLGWSFLSTIDPTKSEKWEYFDFKIPLQFDYFLSQIDRTTKPYLKAEFVNEFGTNWNKRYQDNVLADSHSFKTYSNSLNVGFGALMNINRVFNFLTEASIGSNLDKYSFSGYQIKLKIGIQIK